MMMLQKYPEFEQLEAFPASRSDDLHGFLHPIQKGTPFNLRSPKKMGRCPILTLRCPRLDLIKIFHDFPPWWPGWEGILMMTLRDMASGDSEYVSKWFTTWFSKNGYPIHSLIIFPEKMAINWGVYSVYPIHYLMLMVSHHEPLLVPRNRSTWNQLAALRPNLCRRACNFSQLVSITVSPFVCRCTYVHLHSYNIYIYTLYAYCNHGLIIMCIYIYIDTLVFSWSLSVSSQLWLSHSWSLSSSWSSS